MPTAPDTQKDSTQLMTGVSGDSKGCSVTRAQPVTEAPQPSPQPSRCEAQKEVWKRWPWVLGHRRSRQLPGQELACLGFPSSTPGLREHSRLRHNRPLWLTKPFSIRTGFARYPKVELSLQTFRS